MVLMDLTALADPAELFQARTHDLVARIEARQTAELAVRRAHEDRRYWSGPCELERDILRMFGVRADQIGLVPRSFLDDRYRRKQRARRRRR